MHTFTAVYLHVVFATWSRQRYLHADIRPRVHAYLAATARNLGCNEVTVGGVEDHVHLLARFSTTESVSSIIGRLKKSSTDFVHEQGINQFRWQRGFAAFSVSQSPVPHAKRYVQHQEEHHRERTFEEELDALLREFGVTDSGLL